MTSEIDTVSGFDRFVVRSCMSDSSVAASSLWRRSSRCVSDVHCVEVADLGEAVALRNSQRPEVSLTVTRAVWRDLVAAVKAGEFG